MGVFRRWLAFNAVGGIGVVVQLTVLATLLRLAHTPYLLATALAVEAAVLHNFLWHQRWTWRDRATTSPRAVLGRLARYHALNGTVSLAGNLLLMAVLAGRLHLDPLLANVVAILTCSIVNFFGSDRLVFARRSVGVSAIRRSVASAALVTVALAYAGSSRVTASELVAELTARTVAAWQAYERTVDERYWKPTGQSGFFAQDQYAAGGRWRETAIAGGVPMIRVGAPAPGAPEPSVPDGRIHHWIGAVFVRGATVDGVLRYLQAHAGQESDSYEDVLASRLINRTGDRLRVFLKLRRSSVITVTYNTEHVVEYRRLGTTRASSRSVATKIAELADVGTPDEHERPAGSDHGFLWRLDAYWRYEQVGDGVLIECESVSLSRSVPMVLRPLVTGTVERIARESLEKTLTSLRAALLRVD